MRSFGIRSKKKYLGVKNKTYQNEFDNYPIHQKVIININSSHHKGMPHPRFQGLVGGVTKILSQKTILVSIKYKKITKQIILNKNHAKKIRS